MCVIKDKIIKRNSVQREGKCEQEFGQINNICLGKSKFLSLENISGIPDEYNDMIKYIIENNSIDKIYLLSHKDKSFLNDKQVKFLVGIIDKTIKWISDTLGVNNNNTFNLIFMGSTAKKYFPSKGQPLTENNINSADSTFYGTSDINIRIYRKEELVKVLIHETIHFTGAEKTIDWNNKHKMNNIFNVDCPKNKLLLTEAIVEALATYINCLIYADIYNENLQKLLNNEIKFGLLQTAKILDHFGFTSVSDFLKNNNRKIIQKTSAFEYHILKTILLINFNKFIDLVKKKELLDKLIMNEFNSIEYQKKVNKYISEIDTLPENIKKTFRMTMTEIKLHPFQD